MMPTGSVAKWEPPFTPEQIEALQHWQEHSHPYTCPFRSDFPHRERYGDKGALVPLEGGLWCPDCQYTQLWSHAHA